MIGIFSVLFFIMVALCLFSGQSVAFALVGGLLLFWAMGRRMGFSHRRLWEMAWGRGKKGLTVVVVISLIGVITGLWRSSGTIAYCIVKGMELITPRSFLPAAFLLCMAFSYVLGTSFGVASTLGVILMALAHSGGVDPVVTAGVVLSGIYFGDRCSPASSAASLVAAVTDTDLYKNVRQMMRTGFLPTALTLGLYILLGVVHPIAGVDRQVLSALHGSFTISWTALLPALVMLLLPLFKVPILYTLLAGSAAAAALAFAVQGFSLPEILAAAWGGYQPADPALARVMSGGGLTSMLSSDIVVMAAGMTTGILDGTGALKSLYRKAEALAGRIGRFPAMIVVSLLCAAVLCNQAVTSMLGQQVMEGCYDDREELAMDLENSGILLAGVVPWSVACSVPLSMLGVGYGAVLYAWLLWLIPLCYLFTKKKYYPGDVPGALAR